MKKAQQKNLDVVELKMLRWMSGVTKLDRIRNGIVRVTMKVVEISKEVQESRLKWYEHVMRREEEYEGKRVVVMDVPRKCLYKCDGAGCAWEEKERKTEADVDGQHQARICRKWTIGKRGAIPSCFEVTSPKHQSHIKVLKVVDEDDSRLGYQIK